MWNFFLSSPESPDISSDATVPEDMDISTEGELISGVMLIIAIASLRRI